MILLENGEPLTAETGESLLTEQSSMPHTIQQARICARVSDILVLQRRATKQQCQAIKTELDTYNVPQMALDKSQVFAANLGAMLDNLQANQTEILAAASAVGVSDFTTRWQALDDARDALLSATTANVGTRLQAIIDGLPDETLL